MSATVLSYLMWELCVGNLARHRHVGQFTAELWVDLNVTRSQITMDIAQLDEMLHGAGNVGHHAQLLYLIELAAVELKVQDLENVNTT